MPGDKFKTRAQIEWENQVWKRGADYGYEMGAKHALNAIKNHIKKLEQELKTKQELINELLEKQK